MNQVATFAGGCFWCLEAVFDRLQGVQSVESGYIGGKAANPTYEAVCEGTTGHAEAVRVTFDPDVVSYEELLEVFFAIHDPTQLNRQGNDVGTQYRSAIFFHDAEQERTAKNVVARLTQDKVFPGPIVTEIVPAAPFYVAEEYHQEYYDRVGGRNPYCTYVIDPKVAKLRAKFASRLKAA
jgi:peptide-methionine (S)-S-oxide reductase